MRTGVVDNQLGVCLESSNLSAPYPNPSRGQTTVHFTVPEGTAATLSVYDVMGRRVAYLPQEEIPHGERGRLLDTSSLTSGLYVLRLQTKGQSVTQKILSYAESNTPLRIQIAIRRGFRKSVHASNDSSAVTAQVNPTLRVFLGTDLLA